MLTIAVICLLSGASAPARAAEFQVEADSLTAVNQVNASSVAYFGAKGFVENPNTATQLTTPGGLYFDGTFYRAWNRQTDAWVYLATTGVAGAGLNADYLDGLDSSAFGDATAANQTTILARIGTSADAASLTPTTLFAGVKGLIGRKFKLQEFTGNGTWTRPAGVDVVRVTMVGGGGGGGSGYSGNLGCGGGGGASFLNYPYAISGDVSVTVGAGGTGGTLAGTDGGATSFGTLTARPGEAGRNDVVHGKSGGGLTAGAASIGHGLGASGGAGACNSVGGSGGPFPGGAYSWGGGGGGSILGSGGNGATAGNSNGFNASGYGAGGGQGSGSGSGGNGTPGIVRVTWWE